MLGGTLVLTLGGSGGTVKNLPRINQDGYSSEYFLDDTTVVYRAKIRHSRDTVKAGTQPFDRHTLTISRFVKPTSSLPLGSLSESSFTIRNDPNGVPADIMALVNGLQFYLEPADGIALKMLGWES